MRLFDTHAHLSDDAFDADRHELIPKLPESGIERIGILSFTERLVCIPMM